MARGAARAVDRVRRVLAEAIRGELRDPRLGFVTLTEVRLSPDQRHAVGYVTVMGEAEREPTLRALNHAAPFLRRLVARRAGLRHAPRLRFVIDDAIERGSRLETIFETLGSGRPDSPDDEA